VDVWVRRSSPRTDEGPSGDSGDEASVAKLIEQLDDDDPFLRISAINGLRGRPDVDHLLIESLFDEYPLVRREAVRALKGVGSAKATEALIEVAGHDPSAEVREEAVAALGAMVRERRGGSGSAPV
jgi:HEAT repeat protein